MEVFWGELLQRHVARYGNIRLAYTDYMPQYASKHLIRPLKEQIHHNRELYLSFIAAIVLNNARPSGYFKVRTKDLKGEFDKCSSHGPQDAEPHDIVNYLACCCAEELLRPLEHDEVCNTAIDSLRSDDVRRYKPLTYDHALRSIYQPCLPKTCRPLNLERVLWFPMSPVYIGACKARQLVPPRYQHYFPSGSCRLSNLDALRLLAECGLKLRILEIFSPAFDNIWWGELYIPQEIISGVLGKLFTSVERVKLSGYGYCNRQALHPGGAYLRFRFYAVLQSLCEQPTFHSLTFCDLILPFEKAKSVLTSFLSSRCASHQSLVFDHVDVCHVERNHRFPNQYSKDLISFEKFPCMPDCAQEHKSLTLRCTSELATWFLHQKEVKLKSLTVLPTNRIQTCFSEVYGEHLQHLMQGLFSLMAHHPSFHVQELILPVSTDDCIKDFEALLANPSLKKLDCECAGVAPIAAGLLKQAKLGTLLELKLHTSSLDPVLFDAIFSLPQLHSFNLSLSGYSHLSCVEYMYKVWKERSCPSLPNFTVQTGSCYPRISDTQKAMLDEMCVQY